MEILIVMSITGLVGLAVSTAMFCTAHHAHYESLKVFDIQERNDLFRRLKFNAGRMRKS